MNGIKIEKDITDQQIVFQHELLMFVAKSILLNMLKVRKDSSINDRSVKFDSVYFMGIARLV